ncbi:MAG: DNA-directed DNA polymerase [Alectoria fallacina]|uniref:DNA-directed DNA polymerase n=1 Tax=Alectoria fallacina TaxID=1903189 RepID=A0A8H3FQL9_9LECA|nr:MAG: DNA-directed DNA polymerase [Alectoria fallacina]
MSKKRRREQPAIDVQLVEIYEDLANVDEYIRLKAAQALLTNFVADGKSTGEQLNEIVRRLLRGLCSGRKAARLGFSVVLTELLIELSGPSGRGVAGLQNVFELIETLKKQSQVSGNVSGQEERDHHFGRLFGAESIIKSGILYQPSTEIEAWSDILDIVYDLAKKKSWLREECGFILFNSIQTMKGKDLKYAQVMIDKMLAKGLSKTPQGIAIWIGIQAEYPSIDLPPGVWHHEDPLNRKENSRLAKILVEDPIATLPQNGTESETTAKGAWTTKLQFAWDVILAELLNVQTQGLQKNAKPAKRTEFAQFWEECIDKTLFAASSSEERKYRGFLLFQRMIPCAPAKLLGDLFTKNLMRCLTNQLASPDRYLHRAAERSIKAILARARSNSNTRAPILRALLDPVHGDITFDKITKTKTVETLTSFVNDPAFEQVVEIYEDLILRPGVEDEKIAASRRQSAADQLVSALRSSQQHPTDKVLAKSECLVNIRRILALLAKCAYFDVENASDDRILNPSPKISQTSREMFRTRISSCLSSLVAKPIGEPSYFAYKLVCDIHGREENASQPNAILNADENVRSVLEKAWQILRKIHSQSNLNPDEEARFFRALELLYSLTILQVHNEEADAVGILVELNHSFKPLLHKKKKRPQDSVTLIEILLSFIAKPSQLFRRLAQQVFTACASELDVVALQSMIEVLQTKENLSGQSQMFDQEDEDGDAGSASDVEEVNAAGVGSTSPSADGESDEGSSNTDAADSDENGGELAALNAKLAQIVGTRPGKEDLDAEDNSSSDEEMTDEQMFELNGSLENIFREQKKATSKKTEKKDAKENITNFKCRVLDLLEIYVKQEHGNSLGLSLSLPILTVIRTTTSPLVSRKACDVMREYARLCKGDGVPEVDDAEPVVGLLETVHIEAMKEGSNAHASACSQASLLLVRVLVAHDRECLRRVVKIYGASQESALFNSSCKVKTSFFTDWLNWCTSARK